LLLSSHLKQPICVYGFMQICNIWPAQTSQHLHTRILYDWQNKHCWLDFLYFWIYPVFILFTHKKAQDVIL